MIESKDNLLQFKSLTGKLEHFSTTCKGGVSSGNYSSFNLGYSSGDEESNVSRNREILLNKLNIGALLTPFQTHTNKICVVNKVLLNLSEENRKDALYGNDALICNVKDVGIGISTADCVPIIVYDTRLNIAAAIHAGWKGTVGRIASRTINKLVTEFNSNVSDLKVGIGPAISQVNFEVGNEVVAEFKNAQYNMDKISYVNPKTNKSHINLWEANKLDLLEAGIELNNIEITDLCTYSNPDLFFSARRQTIKSGRMITGFVIR